MNPWLLILCANLSEHSVCSIFIGGVNRHIKFLLRGFTQKKEYNIQNMAKFEIKKYYFMLLLIKFHILMYVDSSDLCTAHAVISSYPLHMYPQHRNIFCVEVL